MTLDELAKRLAPITEDALASSDRDVLKVATILAAVLGSIDGPPIDYEALDPLAVTAGLICEHRTGKHTDRKQRGVK
jgi:hypothetical protein